ncbi:helix-turn-helix domain-containing protein [Actinokineospora soli]|uniref:Helix-turn-helix domain-containing protein n=1 Tax=Actinokineospora soli TaxID=1048753 RepID=A0ABW2TGW2_9PSEU
MTEALPRPQMRGSLRDQALHNALRKRAASVPTYSVPEAAALLSISPEYLYRLIHADGFPAVQLGVGETKGRYVVPAQAVERLLSEAADSAGIVDAAQWTGANRASGGAA